MTKQQAPTWKCAGCHKSILKGHKWRRYKSENRNFIFIKRLHKDCTIDIKDLL